MRLLLALLLFTLVVPRGYEAKAQTQNPAREEERIVDPPIQPPPTSAPDTITPPATTNQTQKIDPAPTPKPLLSHAEWILLGITAACLLLTGFYVVSSRKTLEDLQRQIEALESQHTAAQKQIELLETQHSATQKQLDLARNSADSALLHAKAIISTERPFLLVYTEGDLGAELWITNCGRTPAQLLYINPVLRFAYPRIGEADQEWAMREPPFYGDHYERGEQFNLAWLAPGERRHFATIDPAVFKMLLPEMITELERGIRAIRIYSAIKYRGIITADVFETRFCYGWTKEHGTYMAGPYGYNKNT